MMRWEVLSFVREATREVAAGFLLVYISLGVEDVKRELNE